MAPDALFTPSIKVPIDVISGAGPGGREGGARGREGGARRRKGGARGRDNGKVNGMKRILPFTGHSEL